MAVKCNDATGETLASEKSTETNIREIGY